MNSFFLFAEDGTECFIRGDHSWTHWALHEKSNWPSANADGPAALISTGRALWRNAGEGHSAMLESGMSRVSPFQAAQDRPT